MAIWTDTASFALFQVVLQPAFGDVLAAEGAVDPAFSLVAVDTGLHVFRAAFNRDLLLATSTITSAHTGQYEHESEPCICPSLLHKWHKCRHSDIIGSEPAGRFWA